jgi:hypothetical protein
MNASCEASELLKPHGDRIIFGITAGGYGISSGSDNSFYKANTTPAYGGYLGVRWYRWLWSQVRYEQYANPIEASLSYGSSFIDVGDLNVAQIEISICIMEMTIDSKWRAFFLPFSYIKRFSSTSIYEDIYYYPGDGSYLYLVRELTLSDNSALGLVGFILQYFATSHATAGIELWIMRGGMPRLSLDVHELGMRETWALDGQSVVFPIYATFGLSF